MLFKIFFFLIVFLLSSFTNAQWSVEGGKLIWPNGPVMPKTLIVYDDATSFQNALDLWYDQGAEEIPSIFYKNAQNWRPALRLQIDVDSSHFTGSTHIIGGISYAFLTTNHGQQNEPVFGFEGVGWSSISGSATWGSGSSIGGLAGMVYSTASRGVIPKSIGVLSVHSFETGANDTIINAFGFKSEINKWGPGSTLVDTFYSFHSSNDKPLSITKFYHFYGKDDYPSYFGGAMIQKVYTYDVSNPPTRGELETEFGPAEQFLAGYNFFIDDNAESANFYHIVSDGVRWWVFTAATAP
ncbi:MAG: hypothetical protein B6D44_10280 [Ignavibacteriales bacterium UTCHB2]|jgi:hypothetical protein|nr:MAG: hypothetical protein B6D44_10280 [Ignavibacteriales bacterium UTCHB2]